jgi:hypothetical protein
LQVIVFKELAQKKACSEEEAMCQLEAELSCGESVFVISTDRKEAICLTCNEVQDLIAELACGKISLESLAEQLKISSYQVHYLIEYMLNGCLVEGILTHSTFTAGTAAKALQLQKAKAQKHEHRRKMQEKQK